MGRPWLVETEAVIDEHTALKTHVFNAAMLSNEARFLFYLESACRRMIIWHLSHAAVPFS